MKEKLLYYAGSREMSPDVEEFLKSRAEELSGTFYRGMLFPKHLIKKGTVLEEWYGSSHWSFDKKIALMFALEKSEGYISEAYEDELIEELGEENVEFVQMIMTTPKLHGVKLFEVLEELGAADFSHEKEITTIGLNFIIEDVEIAVEDGEIIYYAKCKVA